ncbi:MAG: hypothetical protein FWD24_02125 [Treponema sp.]|nr:hypothetical protein [Treponema sp.]
MRSINVQISEVEYNAFGFLKDNIPFSEFADLIERQMARQALRRCVSLADSQGLSNMSIDEINSEINAVRNCKK